ncbi:APC family permease [Nitrososphaera viennensis]|uniref:Amino acid permease n=2 Tax=Nitrososphaera viennensis TaxID=1034015 RepID=A0A977IF38_9ARCH|nr:amino acid permease [Nitrososphaera viennensis]AIC14596.1 putative amino acid transporter [Nitrososphaera viennensis EN76]UVS69563.1 amino acid permease [Nitrososphaera viennensis]
MKGNALKAKEPGLKQSISLFQAIMYGTGLILGAGIYVLIGDVAGIAGNAVWISFALAAAIATFTGLSYAELASIFPKSAAEYVFVKNTFGNNLFAFISGWLIIFVAVVSAAAVAIGFSGYLAAFLPGLDQSVSAMLLVAVLSVVNFIGIRESMWTNTAFTLIEIAGLAIIICAGLLFTASSPAATNYFEMPSDVTSFPLAFGAIVGAASLAFFAYFGFENLANISEETKNARKAIPLALVASIAITTGIYMLVAVSAVALVGWEVLSSSNAPLTLAAEKVFGKAGIVILSSIALFATSNTVLMMLVSGSRIIFGMSTDKALPSLLSSVHLKTKTPLYAVLAIMMLVIGVVAASSARIDAMVRVAVFGIFIVYMFVNLSLIWLRYKKPDMERPFRSPLNIGRFPMFAGLGLVTSIAMLTQFDLATVVAGMAAAASGVVAYAILKRI